MIKRKVYCGKLSDGLSEDSARIECNKRNSSMFEYTWTYEAYMTTTSKDRMMVKRWRVIGMLKDIYNF